MTFTKTVKGDSNLMDDGKPARRFRWLVEIEVDEIWVADGFEITEEIMQAIMQEAIAYAREDETRCRIVRAPDPKLIREAQGYKD